MDKATNSNDVNKRPLGAARAIARPGENASNLHVKFVPNPLPDGSILRLIQFEN